MLLVGILPGPHEASHDINSLQPLVDELSQFWKGVNMNVRGYGTKKLVKCGLLCGSCDIPVGRKAFSFLGNNARLGCLKSVPGSFGSMDYSGFDRENWPPRTRAAQLMLLKNSEHVHLSPDLMQQWIQIHSSFGPSIFCSMENACRQSDA